MLPNTNISIIQLIKTGDISVDVEIESIRAKGDINTTIKSYLSKLDYYNEILELIQQAQSDLQNAFANEEIIFYEAKLESLFKVKQDYIVNALYLAEALANMNARTDKLQKAIILFEAGNIKEADRTLYEADLLNDQYALIVFVNYQEKKVKFLENGFDSTNY